MPGTTLLKSFSWSPPRLLVPPLCPVKRQAVGALKELSSKPTFAYAKWRHRRKASEDVDTEAKQAVRLCGAQ